MKHFLIDGQCSFGRSILANQGQWHSGHKAGFLLVQCEYLSVSVEAKGEWENSMSHNPHLLESSADSLKALREQSVGSRQ
jgi:hypothetical protein